MKNPPAGHNLESGVSAPARPDSPIMCTVPEHADEADARRRTLVLQIASDRMGDGDDHLGTSLLRSFLRSLLQMDRRPDTIVFYNAGVTLCCSGSPVLEELGLLEGEDVDMLVSGASLEHLDLDASLAVGRRSDTLEIASRLLSAGHLVRL